MRASRTWSYLLRAFWSVLLVSLSLQACGPQDGDARIEVDEEGTEVAIDEGPLATDSADRSCGVVLREVKRQEVKTGGYSTSCEANGTCHVVFTALIDVPSAKVVDGSSAGLTWRASGATTWRRATGTKVTGGAPGFQRYKVRMSRGTFTTAATPETLASLSLELAAYHRKADGSRAFDHNRNGGDLDNAKISSRDGWKLSDDASVCHPNEARRATLRFTQEEQREQQKGAIVAGGKLNVEYDLYRMPQCMHSTYNGMAAWATTAYGRFLPGGQRFDAALKGSRDYSGKEFVSLPFEVDVPADATSVELWFLTSGRMCTNVWDSRDGQNYRFPVVPMEAAPQPVMWAGNLGGSFARDCAHRDGLEDPRSIDSYVMERACSFVDVEVYVPGLTDVTEQPELLLAQSVWSKDGEMPSYTHLRYVGRAGNNYRYRWELPRGDMRYTTWSEYRYAFRFSTDGRSFYRVGRGAGPEGGSPKVIKKAF